MALYNEEKKFAQFNFERALLLNQVKSIVRSHEDEYDSQVVHKYLLQFHVSSFRVVLMESVKLHCLATAAEEECKGTEEGFILH